MWVPSLGQENILEESMATHSSILSRPGKSHELRSLTGYRLQVGKEPDMSEVTEHKQMSIYCCFVARIILSNLRFLCSVTMTFNTLKDKIYALKDQMVHDQIVRLQCQFFMIKYQFFFSYLNFPKLKSHVVKPNRKQVKLFCYMLLSIGFLFLIKYCQLFIHVQLYYY